MRHDNGELIPGTEGIELGPGIGLARRDLRYADRNVLFRRRAYVIPLAARQVDFN